MPRTACIFLLPGLVALIVGCGPTVRAGQPHAESLEQLELEQVAPHVRFLADLSLGGRCAGTAGNRVAGQYIAAQFGDMDLTPAGSDGSFFQIFTLQDVLEPTDRSDLKGPGLADLKAGRDFSVSAAGCDGAFSAPLVFAGYGLHNRIRSYDDYQRISVNGAVAMILLGEPHDRTGQSLWALRGKFTRLAGVKYKLRQAANRGAVAALLVAPASLTGPEDPLEDTYGDGTGPIPAMRISRAAANALLARADTDIETLVQKIRTTGRAASFAVGQNVAGTASLTEATGRNIVAYLPPTEPGPERVILVGAHYDHLPATGENAYDQGPGIRPGADDNASGMAALLQLARAVRLQPRRRVGYYFVAFDAEEAGFQGSKHFVANLPVEIEQIAAMVNIDQLGHVKNNRLLLLGSVIDGPVAVAVRSARPFSALRLQTVAVTNGIGWSDQMAFAREGIDTLFAYAGQGPHYHTRQDTIETLNYPGLAAAARSLYHILRHLEAAL